MTALRMIIIRRVSIKIDYAIISVKNISVFKGTHKDCVYFSSAS